MSIGTSEREADSGDRVQSWLRRWILKRAGEQARDLGHWNEETTAGIVQRKEIVGAAENGCGLVLRVDQDGECGNLAAQRPCEGARKHVLAQGGRDGVGRWR